MELRHLRYFVVLADELHFGRAARRLSISQPPLSVAIRQLEESVGARLFERNSKEVRLTPAGEALRISARRLLQQAQEAALEARDVAFYGYGPESEEQALERLDFSPKEFRTSVTGAHQSAVSVRVLGHMALARARVRGPCSAALRMRLNSM